MAGESENQAVALEQVVATTAQAKEEEQHLQQETPEAEESMQDTTTASQSPPKPTNKDRRLAKRAAKAAIEEEPQKQRHKQRRELDVINRIRWDERYKPSDIIIGYLDRHAEQGLLEIDFEAWERESTAEEFIPLHRIKYFRRRDDKEFLWHRNFGIDRVFGDME